MKKILFTTLAVSAVMAAFAEPIGREEARAIASAYLNSVRRQTAEPVLALSQNEAKSIKAYGIVDAPAFYVFNASDGHGFVVVSGDDDFPSIIGYSNDGFFPSSGQMPEGLNDLLSFYSQYVADVRSGIAEAPVTNLDRSLSRASVPVVAPLCTSKWSQDDPYNMYAPKIGSTTCPVGCVATAMSQLMYFWKYPERGNGQVSYEVPSYGIPISENLSESVYDWSRMSNAVTNSSSEASKEAVAKLCYDAGVSVSMQYAPYSSGAFDLDALAALVNNFGYSSSVQLVYRDCYAKLNEWQEVMKSELDAGRPIYFSAQSPSGGGKDAGGHAFIVDGYDTDDFAHVNWGWGGLYDGYYSISRLDPGNYAFTAGQAMMVGLRPASEGAAETQSVLYLESAPSLRITGTDRDSEFSVYLSAAYNICSPKSPVSWTIGVGLYRPDGTFVADVCTESESDRTVTDVEHFYGFGQATLKCQIPESIPEGDYVLKLSTKEVGFDSWILPAVVGGASKNEFPVWVTSSELRFNEVSSGIDGIGSDDADVVSKEWFDLSGRKIEAPVKGQTYIERVTLSNGKVESVKKIF